MVTLINNAKN